VPGPPGIGTFAIPCQFAQDVSATAATSRANPCQARYRTRPPNARTALTLTALPCAHRFGRLLALIALIARHWSRRFGLLPARTALVARLTSPVL
jgi:hypothetical protein